MEKLPELLHPTAPPSRTTYKEWYQARKDRTMEAIHAGRVRISGNDVRRENLSMKVLYDMGYTLDNTTDTMVKE